MKILYNSRLIVKLYRCDSSTQIYEKNHERSGGVGVAKIQGET